MMHVMRSREALKLHLLGLSEIELPAVFHQSLQQGGHQYLLAIGLGRYPGSQDHALAEEVFALWLISVFRVT